MDQKRDQRDYHRYIYDLENRRILNGFDAAYTHCDDVWPTQHRIDSLKHRLAVDHLNRLNEKKTSILDIGCGYGDFAHHLTQLGYQPIGCDISAAAIEKGKRRWPIDVRLEVGNLLDGLPYSDQAFSFIVCFGLFSLFLDKLPQAFGEIHRLLHKQGLLMLSVEIPKNPIGGEFVSDYADFLQAARRHFFVEQAILIYDQQDLENGKTMMNCHNDFILYCRKAKSA